ncbi:hypothetical protein ABK040_000450 [Willaertia magna]
MNNRNQIEQQINLQKEMIKDCFCPLSFKIMKDPVIIESGYSFERDAILKWFLKCDICPITKIKLKSKDLIINNHLNVKNRIENYLNYFVIKNVREWIENEELFDVCKDLINDSLQLILNNENFKELEKELFIFKFEILFLQKDLTEEQFYENYLNCMKEINDIHFKLLHFFKIEEKLTNENILNRYYNDLLNLLIFLNNKDYNDLQKDIFIKYCKLNKLNLQFITNILNSIEDDKLLLEYYSILNETNYDKYDLLNKIINLPKIEDEILFISIIKNMLKEINLNFVTDKLKLLRKIEIYNDLKDEIKFIYLQLYHENNDITYLEKVYNLDNNDKEIGEKLLNKYLELQLLDKFMNFYLKLNSSKLDPLNLMFMNLLKIQNLKLENLNYEFTNTKTQLLNKINNLESQLEQQILINAKNKLSKWKNDFMKIITIETSSNIYKYNYFHSEIFEAFGLQWKIEFYPKGEEKSKSDECAIYIYLNDKQICKEQREISSIKTKFFISNCNVDENSMKLFDYEFTKLEGYGEVNFKQIDFIPFIENDKQFYKILIGMKKVDIKYNK